MTSYLIDETRLQAVEDTLAKLADRVYAIECNKPDDDDDGDDEYGEVQQYEEENESLKTANKILHDKVRMLRENLNDLRGVDKVEEVNLYEEANKELQRRIANLEEIIDEKDEQIEELLKKVQLYASRRICGVWSL